MKKRITYLMMLALAVVSCSLKETPEHFVNPEHFYNTEAQCRSALNHCYNDIKNIYNGNMFYLTEIQSDLWWNTASGQSYDATLEITPASPGHGKNIWTYAYRSIMYCNDCVEFIATSPVPEEVKMPMVAEARVLRAFYYHILTQVFNGVPFYLYRVDSKETMEAIRKLPRTPAEEIRKTLYKDLEENALPYFTVENGLRRRTFDDESKQFRAGYAMALYLMANFAMWNKDYALALEPLRLLEKEYGELTEEAYPLEDTKWSIKNTAESIFEVQHSWDVAGIQYYSNLASRMCPPQDAADPDHYYDGVELKWMSARMTTGAATRANAYYANADVTTPSIFGRLPMKKDGSLYVLDLDMISAGQDADGVKIDRRVYLVLGLGNYETGATFTHVSKSDKTGGITGYKPYSGPKFWCPTQIANYDSNNYKICRYADAVLMMSECYYETGDMDQARKYINMTRVRAGLDPVADFANDDAYVIELRKERARELGGEFHRKFDLVRWGVWYEQLAVSSKGTMRDNRHRCHRYYPIPDTECALSGGALTNDEYIAEGL